MAIEIVATYNGSVILSVRVQPRAPRTNIVGELGGALKIRLAAPPVDGKANEELIRFFAQIFNLPRKEIEIISGEKSRNKQLRINGISVDQIRREITKNTKITK